MARPVLSSLNTWPQPGSPCLAHWMTVYDDLLWCFFLRWVLWSWLALMSSKLEISYVRNPMDGSFVRAPRTRLQLRNHEFVVFEAS